MKFKTALEEYGVRKISVLEVLKETNFKRALSVTSYDKFKYFWDCGLWNIVDNKVVL